MLRPKALDHVALTVTDMDKTLHFYHQLLGLELLRTSDPGADGGRSAVLKVGDQEINVFSRPDFVSVANHNSGGMDHFCLNMDAASIDEVMADLRQAGVGIFRGPVERRDGISVFVYDPDGVHVELRVAKGPIA
jgi:catechol 2,3-dioxygenase-like lactoylglutathione lyase family enzyme